MKFAASVVAALSVALVAVAAPVEKRETHSGSATYYMQGGNAGSCGQYHSDSDYIVAMPSWLHQSSNCGDSIKVTYNGKSITALIADTCPTCDGYHIDLSSGAFTALASESTGEINVEWYKM